MGATEPMGLQHALDDIEHRPGDAEAQVGDSEPALASDEHRQGARRRLTPVLRKMARLARAAVDVRESVWRVVAVALVAYILAFSVSYFLVLKPVWTRLDAVIAKKALIHDFMLFRESNTAVAGFRNALMQGDQRVTVVTELEGMAREVGLRPIGETKLPPSKDLSPGIKEHPMELRLSGSYHEVGEYLSLLEAAPRFLLVKEVEIVTGDGRSDESEVTILIAAVSWEE